jgi:hypothetical protein
MSESTDYMLGRLLDHYSQLNLEGKISEEQMESKMDWARLLSKEKMYQAYKRLLRKKKK